MAALLIRLHYVYNDTEPPTNQRLVRIVSSQSNNLQTMEINYLMPRKVGK